MAAPTTAVMVVRTDQVGFIAIRLTDKGGNGADTMNAALTSRRQTDCSPYPGPDDFGQTGDDVLTDGRATVFDRPQQGIVTLACTLNEGTPTLRARFSGFPPDEPFLNFRIVAEGTTTSVIDGEPVPTNSTGDAFSRSFVVSSLPARIGLVLYRDNQENERWDPDSDDAFYRGDATIDGCPQTVTVSPK